MESKSKGVSRLCVLLMLAASLSVTALFGCDGTNVREGIFDYQLSEHTADISFICNGYASRLELVYSGGERVVDFTYPEELSGLSVCYGENGARVAFGELSVEAPEALTTIPRILAEVFSLREDMIVGIQSYTDGDESFTTVDTSNITVTLDRDGIPVKAEGVACGVSFSATIENFCRK